MTSGNNFALIIVELFVVILSVSIHEFGHAYAAFKLGDDTAARQGRLTLNPLPLMKDHPQGMVILPLLGAFLGVTFAYASTPVSLHRVNRRWSMRQANFIITIAGPLMNFLLACLGITIIVVLHKMGLSRDKDWGIPLTILADTLVIMNLRLFFFNLLPVPPLDGFSVLFSLLPRHFEGLREQMERHGFLLFAVVFLVGGRLIAVPMRATYEALLRFAGLL